MILVSEVMANVRVSTVSVIAFRINRADCAPEHKAFMFPGLSGAAWLGRAGALVIAAGTMRAWRRESRQRGLELQFRIFFFHNGLMVGPNFSVAKDKAEYESVLNQFKCFYHTPSVQQFRDVRARSSAKQRQRLALRVRQIRADVKISV